MSKITDVFNNYKLLLNACELAKTELEKTNVQKMNKKQRNVYDALTNAINAHKELESHN